MILGFLKIGARKNAANDSMQALLLVGVKGQGADIVVVLSDLPTLLVVKRVGLQL